MATTLAGLRAKERVALRDTAQPYHVEDAELDESTRAAMVTVAGDVPLGEKWVAGAVTLTAGSDTATLPATVEYHMIYGLRRTSDGMPLFKRTMGELEGRFWCGRTVANATPAEPTDYALSENESNVVAVRFQAPALTASTLDLRRAVIPADLTAATDAAPLSTLLEQAVADLATADIISKLTKNELDALRLDRGYAAVCLKRAAKAIHDEKVRLDAMHSTGRVQRYVS